VTVDDWTADRHMTAGDELLTQAHNALAEDAGDDPLMIERVESSAGNLASLATAHYTAAAAIVAKHQAEVSAQVDSRWNWRGAAV
jgi:hypothetical protein